MVPLDKYKQCFPLQNNAGDIFKCEKCWAAVTNDIFHGYYSLIRTNCNFFFFLLLISLEIPNAFVKPKRNKSVIFAIHAQFPVSYPSKHTTKTEK